MFASFPGTGLLSPIFENAEIAAISPESLDTKLVIGWRHFGKRFFRCNFALHEGRLCGILPLRIPISDFALSKSQRRVLRRNADLKTQVVPAYISTEIHELFDRHKERFDDNVPDSIYDFLDPYPARIPCDTRMVEVRSPDGRLLAASFFDVGASTTSGVYALFDPAEERRTLGIYTLLKEIEFSASLERRFYYLGYSYTVPSHYDYKKQFVPLEAYDWNVGWKPLPPSFEWSRTLEHGAG